MRWATPVIHFRRTATRDAVVGGQEIKAGEKVVMFYNSANRDERAFADPFRFDVTRTPNEHVGFGAGGPHFCLGANLARREIRVMFEELFRRLPDIEITGEPDMLQSGFIHGIKRMPCAWSACLVIAEPLYSGCVRIHPSTPRWEPRRTDSRSAPPGRPQPVGAGRGDRHDTVSGFPLGARSRNTAVDTLVEILRACGFEADIVGRPKDSSIDRAQIRNALRMTPEQRIQSSVNVSRMKATAWRA